MDGHDLKSRFLFEFKYRNPTHKLQQPLNGNPGSHISGWIQRWVSDSCWLHRKMHGKGFECLEVLCLFQAAISVLKYFVRWNKVKYWREDKLQRKATSTSSKKKKKSMYFNLYQILQNSLNVQRNSGNSVPFAATSLNLLFLLSKYLRFGNFCYNKAYI